MCYHRQVTKNKIKAKHTHPHPTHTHKSIVVISMIYLLFTIARWVLQTSVINHASLWMVTHYLSIRYPFFEIFALVEFPAWSCYKLGTDSNTHTAWHAFLSTPICLYIYLTQICLLWHPDLFQPPTLALRSLTLKEGTFTWQNHVVYHATIETQPQASLDGRCGLGLVSSQDTNQNLISFLAVLDGSNDIQAVQETTLIL